METKQHAIKKKKQANEEIKGKLKNTLRQMIMKTQPFKIDGMPQKQFLEGSSQQYRPSQKKKNKNLKSTS